MFDSIKHAVTDRLYNHGFDPIVIDADLFDQFRDALSETPLVQVQPKKDNPGIEAGPNLMETLYNVRLGKFGYRNRSHTHSFEMWYDESKVQFCLHPGSEEARNRFEKQIQDKYPGSRVSDRRTKFPTIEEGDFVAGATLDLRREFWYPIRCPSGIEEFERDPYGPLTSEMVVEEEQTRDGTLVDGDDVRMLVQVMFQPAKRSWSRQLPFGVDCETRGMELKKGRLKGGLAREIAGNVTIEEPSRKLKKAGELVAKQRGEPGFYVRIRVLAISPYREIVQRHARGVAEVFEQYYNAVTEQGLDATPVRRDALRETFLKTAGREMHVPLREKLNTEKTILTAPELAGVAHIPNADIETPNVDWTRMATGPGVPADSDQLKAHTETGNKAEGSAATPASQRARYPPARRTPHTGGTAGGETSASDPSGGDN